LVTQSNVERVEHFPGVSAMAAMVVPCSPPRKNFNTEEEFRTFLGNAEARQSSLTEVGTPPLTLIAYIDAYNLQRRIWMIFDVHCTYSGFKIYQGTSLNIGLLSLRRSHG